MECDTAASQNILSQETFQRIWPRGSGPKLSYRKVKIILADGSRSAQETRSMECSVVAANGLKLRLQFFILNGPNNLLGRFALSKIWPGEYSALKEVAEVPVKKLVAPGVKSQKSQHRSSWPKSQHQSVAEEARVQHVVDPATPSNRLPQARQHHTPTPSTAVDDVTAVE